MRSFGSDNHSGIHPNIINAIISANVDHCCAYGDDKYTLEATNKIKEVFGNSANPFFVFNGTGANILSIKACTNTFDCVIAAKSAHIVVDECGAPEFIAGVSVKTIDTKDGKLTPELIKQSLIGFGDEHHSQPKVIYISQVTEFGTVYTTDEIKAIADLAHQHNMYLHIDGARLANAAVSLNKSLKEITVDCGCDILSFGGTKNGMMLGESVIAFKPELAKYFKFIRKQSMQLYSKMRFSACQFTEYLSNDLWKQNATHANKMAQILRTKLEQTNVVEFTQNTDANTILLKMDKSLSSKLLKEHFFYYWDANEEEIRLVTSWDTTIEDIDNFIKSINSLTK